VLVTVALALAGCGPAAAPPEQPFEQALLAEGLTRTQRAGREVFRARCATCHGETGRGDGQNAYTLEPPPPDLRQALPRQDPAYWQRVVQGGSAAVERSPLCPPWGRSLAAHEVEAVLAYLAVLARETPGGPPPS
jgi:mono/diheme cytochrome c family protein